MPSTSLLRSDYLSMAPVTRWLRSVALGYASGILVDYGCGNSPYLPLFQDRITKYIGVDVTQNASNSVHVVVLPGEKLPFNDGSIDTILSTQVLEHVQNPQMYILEVARVLKRGGYCILTCPASYMLHEEPDDYYRYTRYGLEHLLTTSGLRVLTIATSGGAWRMMGQTFLNHRSFGRTWRIPILSSAFHYPVIVVVNALCGILDRLNTNEKDPSNYMLVAQK
jgi:SAM-dependent methyltransferase